MNDASRKERGAPGKTPPRQNRRSEIQTRRAAAADRQGREEARPPG